jgi:hypothetical protein
MSIGQGTTLSTSLIASSISLGTGPDIVTFLMSEDAYLGNAEFILTVDGVQVGGVQTISASHAAGQEESVSLAGNFTTSGARVGIDFINDAYGGSPILDRNLYVDGVALDGVTLRQSRTLESNGTAMFGIGGDPAPVAVGSGPQVIEVVASDDYYAGDAEMKVSVDGVRVGGTLTVTAIQSAGQVQDFYIDGNFGSGTHTISVAFINDAYGGSPSEDRNLNVQSASLDGPAIAGLSGTLDSTGSISGAGTIATQPAVAAAVTPATTPAATPEAGATGNVGLVPVGAPVYAAGAHVLTVGAGEEYQTIAAAINASRDGDVILVNAGTYTNDFAILNANVTLIAVGGRVDMVATVAPPDLKGLLTVENGATVEGFTFSGVQIPDADGHNGAGIRLDNGNLTLVNDEFDGNQEGLLTNAGSESVTIDHSVFKDNGGPDPNGVGNIHNAYIGAIASLTVTNSIFENAQVGHELKSRAAVNTLTNNEFISGVGIGTGSYDIDLPNGGVDTLTDNTIIKGPNAENSVMVHFGGEGIPYAGSSLTLQGNLFENAGNANPIALLNQTAITARITGNEFSGVGAGSISQGPAQITGNFDGGGNPIANQTLAGVLPGSTLFITDALAHTVTLDGTGGINAVEGGAGLLTVYVDAGHVIIIGGAGGMDVIENATTGGNQYTTVAASTDTLDLVGVGEDTIDSEGNDTIIAGNGNQTAVINGTADVVGGAGNSYWTVNGSAAIDTGSGSAFMTLGAAANLAITGTNSFFELNSNGGTATWNTTNSGVAVTGSASAGAFSMQVYNGVMAITTAGGAIGTVLHLGQGGANVTSVGADTVYAGSGTDSVIVSGGATVYVGTGALSVFAKGGGDGANVYGAGGTYTIGGDTGGITYHGGNLASTVLAELSSITLLGGGGLLTIEGGSRETITGGLGGLNVQDLTGGANDITTAAGSSNVLDVNNSDIHSFGGDTIVSAGGNVAMDIHGNSSLTLQGGNSSIYLYGTDTVTTTGGADALTVVAGANVSLNSVTADSVQETRARLAVTFTDPMAGSAVSKMSVTGGSASVTTSPGGGIAAATVGAMPTQIVASGNVAISSAGADNISLGAGAASVILTGSGAAIGAGSGTVALQDDDWTGGTFLLKGGAGAISVALNGPNTMTFVGGSGAAALTGGTMNIDGGAGSISASGGHIASFRGGSGAATLSLDSHGSSITFGSGIATVNELNWGNANSFSFAAATHGAETVNGFRIGTDRAVLGTGVSIVTQSLSGGAAHFALSNGANVTFAGETTTNGIFS